MIRRDELLSGQFLSWILTSQISHARLARAVAKSWDLTEFDTARLTADLLVAAACHDDGWDAWDARPGIDPTSGRPLAFDEMELADTLAIWTRSIELAASRGPMVGFLVAGHFCRLLERFDSWKNQPQKRSAAEAFLAANGRLQTNALAIWLQIDQPDHEQSQLAQHALDYLQMFDAVSLWLCCAPRREPQNFHAGPEAWTFSPVTPTSIRIEPWPLLIERLELKVTGHRLPVGRYADASAVVAALGESVELRWELVA